MADLGQEDLDCVTDLADDCRTVSGRPALAQSLARRWNTYRGALVDDPNYGTYLPDYINDDMSPRDIAMLQTAAEAEAQKDERVESISSTARFDPQGTLFLDFVVQDGAGPFSLTIAVSSVTVDLLRVQQ